MAYKINIEKEVILQCKEQLKELAEEGIIPLQENAKNVDRQLMDMDPTKLWAQFTQRVYSNETNQYYSVERIGFVQAIYFSTGKIRISLPTGGHYDTNNFTILNPEALPLVLENCISTVCS